MSNESALIADDIPGPARADEYQGRKAKPIAWGPMAVPVFWLSLFDEPHLESLKVEEEEEGMILEIPMLVAEMGDARRLLTWRREVLAERFPEFQPTWDQFAKVIQRLKAGYIKLDVLELWEIAMAVDEDFTSDLRSSVRWFTSQDEADFERLLSVANIIGYDRARRTFSDEAAGVPRAFHMRGYAYNDKYWDDKSDI